MSDAPVLVFGIGNPGREDDALGPALLERLEADPVPGVDLDCDYQLLVEDAADIAQHAVVIFVDASVDGPEPYSFTEIIEPTSDAEFSTHGARPSGVLGLAHEIFDATTRGFVLGIRGYSFAMFTEEMTDAAKTNLDAAEAFLRRVLDGGIEEIAGAVG